VTTGRCRGRVGYHPAQWRARRQTPEQAFRDEALPRGLFSQCANEESNRQSRSHQAKLTSEQHKGRTFTTEIIDVLRKTDGGKEHSASLISPKQGSLTEGA